MLYFYLKKREYLKVIISTIVYFILYTLFSLETCKILCYDLIHQYCIGFHIGTV